jgi:molybdopterin-guanine dinucleotide biosynthesis protein A
MKPKVSGIVLAGGKSSRMGMEKGLVEFRGKPLVTYAIDALKIVCDEILISSNTDTYDFLGYPVISDVYPNCGPMGGIYSCLLKSKNQLNFVLSCDMPLINEEIVSALVGDSEGFDVTIPWHEKEYFEPLCAVYERNTIPVFAKFIEAGNFKIPDLLREVNTKKIQTGKGSGLDAEIFFNVNSKKQLLELDGKEIPKRNLTGFQNLLGLTQIPNLIVIAGTGRKVGKTTLACNLIKHFSKSHNVLGIKVSPHFHKQVEGQKIIAQSAEYLILEETSPASEKDSSRMLRAGASKVYYLQTKDRQIKEPFQIIMELTKKNQAVICESGALLNYAKPGLFLLVKREGQTATKKGIDQLPYHPDRWVTFDGEGFDLGNDSLRFSAKGWLMSPEY